MSNPLPLTFAGPPFDNPTADVVIRSPDGVHFRVRSAILSEASPVFSDMLTSNPLASERTTDGKHLLVVPEESAVLDPLLRLCYPVTDPVFTDLKDVRLVLAAAMKYRMTEARTLLKKLLCSYIDGQPLRVWAAACLLRLEEEARAAASALFGKEFPVKAPPEFEQVSSGDYFRFTKFLRTGANVPESFKFWDPAPEDIPKAEHERQRPHSLFQELGVDSPAIAFQPRPYADIICRSSDRVEFRAHRIILCLASSVLNKKISRLCPEPPPVVTATPSTLPVLEFKDTPGSVLGPVLEACYPNKRRHPTQLDLHVLMPMMDCARKYDIQQAQEYLCRGAFWLASRERPLTSYLMAARMGFSDYARSTLPNLSGELHIYGCPSEMEDTPATIYHTLLINRHQSSVATSRLTGTVVTRTPPSTSRAPTASTSEANNSSTPTVAKSKAKPKAPEAPDPRDPWLLSVWRQTVQGLQGCRSNELWKFEPNVAKLLKESLERKIWCSKCEMNLSLMSSLHDMYKSVRAAKFDHDYTRKALTG
ncbi:hypothetical protein LXA43DRAFT_569482 [Ganoderma leucocontextum]|nr:hypothetical protein LXA43DRAFT_569482 [Ganoderma leucocontextum]